MTYGHSSGPIAEQGDVRKVHMGCIVQRLVGGDALDSQVLSERDEQGVIKRAVVLYRDIECFIHQARGRFKVKGKILQLGKPVSRFVECDRLLAMTFPD